MTLDYCSSFAKVIVARTQHEMQSGVELEMLSKFYLLQIISVSSMHHLKYLCELYTKQFSELQYLISNQSYDLKKNQ